MKRLFNRLKADFTPVTAHTYIQASSFIRINAHIIHYSYRDYPDMVVKCKNTPDGWPAIWQTATSNFMCGSLLLMAHGLLSVITLSRLVFWPDWMVLTLSICKGLGLLFKVRQRN